MNGQTELGCKPELEETKCCLQASTTTKCESNEQGSYSLVLEISTSEHAATAHVMAQFDICYKPGMLGGDGVVGGRWFERNRQTATAGRHSVCGAALDPA